MKAMILAAGLGERLRPLTDTTPKPLLPIAGKPLMQYHVENLVAAGITEVVINVSWLADKIQAYFRESAGFGATISWSKEEAPLETGGGIRNALPLLGRDVFLVINGDIWSRYPLEMLANRKLAKDSEAHLVLVKNPDHHPEGDFCLAADGRIGLKDAGDKSKPTYTFSGISLLRPELFARMTEAENKFPLRKALRGAIEQGRVTGELFEGDWWDIGTMERLQALNRHLMVMEDGRIK